MVKLIKKLLLDLSNDFIDEKKVITIGKYDTEFNREIYYVSKVFGSKRYGKKDRLTKEQAQALISKAKNVTEIKSY